MKLVRRMIRWATYSVLGYAGGVLVGHVLVHRHLASNAGPE